MSELRDLTITREAFGRTVRLVSSARMREPVMSSLVDNEDELAELAEIEGATSGRRLAQRSGTGGVPKGELRHDAPHAAFINASFVYARPRQPNRFNDSTRGAWYAALDVETAISEVTFHLTRALADVDDFNAVVEYAEMYASVAGEFVDLRYHPAHPALAPDLSTGYPAGNALAAEARATGLVGIIYPSVRHEGGTCIVALWPHVVQSVAQGDVWRMTWKGDPQPQIEKASGER